jgi:hypothetical protein
MGLIVAALLGLSGLLIVIYPLLGLDPAARLRRAEHELDALNDGERAAKDALRDVEFDYRLGNLDERDYRDMREHYERRALAALKSRYERERELDAIIDAQLAALRATNGRVARTGAAPRVSPVGTRSAAPSSNGHKPVKPVTRGPGARRRKGV